MNFIKKVNSLCVTSYYFTTDFAATKINKIEKSLQELAIYLQVKNVVLKKDNINGCIIFELENKNKKILSYNDINKKSHKKGVVLKFGKSIDNKLIDVDFCKLPHLLVAGTTGSGKSVFINTLICQLIQNYNINEISLMLIDVKIVEFSIYNNVPLLYNENIITTTEEAKQNLNNILNEINFRYNLLKNYNCRNIDEYNLTSNDKMKKIFVFVDELADLLIQDKKHKIKNDIENNMTIEEQLIRIAQIGRAAGVHLILATQRPSSDIITGLLKANIPSRVALSVATATDSRVILDAKGAENLNGNGDMLFKQIGSNELLRIQGAYIDNTQILKILEETKQKYNNVITERENKKIEEAKMQELDEAELLKKEKRKKALDTTFNILKIFIYVVSFTVLLPITFIILVVLAACKNSK